MSLFSPTGLNPIAVLDPFGEVCEFLLEELVRWLVSTGQVNVSISPGRQRFLESAPLPGRQLGRKTEVPVLEPSVTTNISFRSGWSLDPFEYQP